MHIDPPAPARVHGGRPPPGARDLSAPQNPLGPPGWALEAARRGLERLSRYPDYEYTRLREAIARLTRGDPRLVVPLNGSAEAVYLLFLALRPNRLVSLEPTFGDHGLLARALGVEWRPVLWRPGTRPPVEEYCALAGRGRVLGLLSNPDNPHGGMVGPRLVEEMAGCTSGVLLVDEAFIRLSDEPSWSLQASPPEGVVVAGSLTKDLALPGARLGYLVAYDPGLARLLDSVRQPWNVNSVAVEVGLEAGRDPGRLESYLARARSAVREWRGFMASVLAGAGLQVYSSKAPYILVRGPPGLHGCLARAGFYARDASSFHGLGRGWLRFSVAPPRLVEGLAEALGGCVGA